MKERKVTYAKLHTEFFAAGLGNLGTTLGEPNKHRGMDITWTPDGLFVEYNNVKFGVPLSNCAGYVFAHPALKVTSVK